LPTQHGDFPEARPAPLDKPIVCPVTIGRQPHLAEIERLLDQLALGHGQTLLVTGEAGIGKSRLVAETKARAEQRAVLVLQGQCFETDRSLPYAPFVDLFRSFLTSRAGGGVADADLADLLPDLAEGQARTPLELDPPQQKRRLFRALSKLVNDLTQDRQVLMVVEDVHWADETSLELLNALARLTIPRPLLLALTFRSDEVDDSLRGLLTALDRERLSVELRLQRLTLDELEAMLSAIFELGRPRRTEFLDLIYGLTEGNPFFVEEVLRALIGAGDIFQRDGAWTRKPIAELRVPRSVDDAVQRRTAQLGAAAREVVALAAVAGRRFDFELLGALSGYDEAALVAIVKQLIAAGLIVEESADQLAFRHALTRQAIYGGLLARERRLLHRRVAETLEQLGRARLEDAVADLAYHYAEAGLAEPALSYARRAGERALRMYAPHAALEHFNRAIDAEQQLGAPRDAELLRLRGQAHDLAGDFAAAEADYSASAEAARAGNDRRTEWAALLDSSLLWAGRDYERTGAYATAALAIAQAIGDQRMIAQTLNRVGNWHMNRDELAESMRHHEQALELFKDLGDERGLAETLDLLGMASSTDPTRSATYYAQAIPLLRKLDDRPRLVNSLAMYMLASGAALYETVSVPTDLVPLSRAEAAGEEALRLAREIEWPAGESFVSWEIALWLAPRGDYGRALRYARSGLDIATAIDHRQWIAGALVTVGILYLDLGAYSDAAEAISAGLTRAREVNSANFIRIGSALLARAFVAQRRLTEAAAILETVLEPGMPMVTAGQRLCWLSWAELQMALGKPALTLETADGLIGDSDGVAPTVWYVRGEALAALGRSAEAADVLRGARAAAESRGARGILWRILAAQARVLRGLGRREEADQALNAARAVLADLADEIDEPALRETFVRETHAVVPPPPAPTAARAAKARFGGLTAREREVARMIARGLSNRAIADHLVLGERTVESYVSNILGKLTFTSRAQIAAWAVEHGLATDDPLP
jgi:DNA-binding CsgD family transcriptional regulator